MSKFFEFHCESKAHCEVCRQRINGKVWRIMMMDAFEDIASPDFECPENKPFIDDEPLPSYDEVCKRIDEAEDSGLWVDLKIESKNHALAIENHPSNTECWKKKQRNRVINMYLVVKQKMTASVASLFLIVLSTASLGFTEPHTIDIQQAAQPRLTATQAQAKTFRWVVQNNGSNMNLTGSFPYMYIAPDVFSTGIYTASCVWVSQVTGIFDAVFSSQDLNTNGLDWIYGVGVTSNAITVFKQGSFRLVPDPFAVGAGPVNFTTNLNASLYTWAGAINGYAVADVLISTTGNTAVANQALTTSTNAVAIAAQATNTAQTVSTNLTAQISIVTNDLNSVSNSLYSQLIATNVASTNFATYLFTIAHTDLVQNTSATLQLIDTVSQSIPPITTAVDRTTNVVSVLTNLIVSGTISPDSTGVYTQAAPLVVATRQWNLSTNAYLQYFTNGAPICMLTNILGGRWDCSTNTTGAPEGLYDPSGGASGTSQVFVSIQTNITYTTNSVKIALTNMPDAVMTNGENVSILVNDAGYLTNAISGFTNTINSVSLTNVGVNIQFRTNLTYTVQNGTGMVDAASATGSTNGINNWWIRNTNTWDLSTAAGYRLGQLTNDNAVHTINLDSYPDFVPSNARAIVVYYDVAVSSLGGTFYLWPGTTYNGNSITIKPKTTGFDEYDSRLLIIGTNRILSYQSGSGADITYVYLALGTGL